MSLAPVLRSELSPRSSLRCVFLRCGGSTISLGGREVQGRGGAHWDDIRHPEGQQVSQSVFDCHLKVQTELPAQTSHNSERPSNRSSCTQLAARRLCYGPSAVLAMAAPGKSGSLSNCLQGRQSSAAIPEKMSSKASCLGSGLF